MSRQSTTKHLAAIHIEDLFQPTVPNNNRWLLTYLDVFILIIMLVISLIALSDFEKEKQSQKQSYQTQVDTPTPQSADLTSNTNTNDSSEIKPAKIKKKIEEIEEIEEKKEIEETVKTHRSETQQKPAKTITETKETTVPVKQKTAILEYHNKAEYKEDKTEQQNQLSDNTLQKQLKITVDQLGLTDSVDMKVTHGYAQLEIQDKILFTSSNASLLDEGQNLLKKLTPLLAQSSGLIYIEGHTDNLPIKTSEFPSNWELGSARATSVLHFLASQNLKTSRLRAITYGDTMPIADNSTKEGREKNRRVSIVIKVSDKVD